ncbi:hypothetical protein GCM10023144_34260 [Pigmentiphaga soli]|uniref:DUF2244 domain-containing protein n=1 Tax=Pigmentiphaga soli TaxID=1007095 RepID=A0ABP8HE68_9BURK
MAQFTRLDPRSTPAAHRGPSGDAGAPAARQWTLKRNCSLSPRQVLAIYGSLTTLSLTFATLFAWKGLWMVLPFSVLENGLLGAALLYYARHALDRETVRIEGDRVVVEVLRSEGTTRHDFNLGWVHGHWGGRRGDTFWLQQGADKVAVGTQVGVAQRRAFAAEFQRALRRRRAGFTERI